MFTGNSIFGDYDFLDLFLGRRIIHYIQHGFLENGA